MASRYAPILFLFLLIPLTAGAVKLPEYQVKAEMMIRIGEFVDWPEGTFPSPESPFYIGIVGENPFGNYLEPFVQNEKIKGHPIVLRIFPHGTISEPCHMVFIARSVQPKIDEILSQVGETPVLSVGDSETMCKSGVHIGFLTSEGHIRFHVNLDSVKRCHLTFPSQLLRLAVKVLGTEDGGAF